jgi:NAD(P)-dependent dehydrogenase (short-subunit alcohol dehydrogenase family)
MSDRPGDLLDFSGAVVFVTGAGAGIGAGIARRFAVAGADLAIHYNANADGAVAVARSAGKLGRRAVLVSGDLTKPEMVTQVFDEVIDTFGKLSVLVNNAGIYPMSPLLTMTLDEWHEMMTINLRSVFLCTQAAARHMVHQSDDLNAIINIASIEAKRPNPAHSHYAASKAGVLAYTQAAALELGVEGIRVNAVSPGLIWREGIETAFADGVAAYREAAPLGLIGHPDDVAHACLFLSSRAARWITGINMTVDGGASLRPVF